MCLVCWLLFHCVRWTFLCLWPLFERFCSFWLHFAAEIWKSLAKLARSPDLALEGVVACFEMSCIMLQTGRSHALKDYNHALKDYDHDLKGSVSWCKRIRVMLGGCAMSLDRSLTDAFLPVSRQSDSHFDTYSLPAAPRSKQFAQTLMMLAPLCQFWNWEHVVFWPHFWELRTAMYDSPWVWWALLSSPLWTEHRHNPEVFKPSAM